MSPWECWVSALNRSTAVSPSSQIGRCFFRRFSFFHSNRSTIRWLALLKRARIDFASRPPLSPPPPITVEHDARYPPLGCKGLAVLPMKSTGHWHSSISLSFRRTTGRVKAELAAKGIKWKHPSHVCAPMRRHALVHGCLEVRCEGSGSGSGSAGCPRECPQGGVCLYVCMYNYSRWLPLRRRPCLFLSSKHTAADMLAI